MTFRERRRVVGERPLRLSEGSAVLLSRHPLLRSLSLLAPVGLSSTRQRALHWTRRPANVACNGLADARASRSAASAAGLRPTSFDRTKPLGYDTEI